MAKTAAKDIQWFSVAEWAGCLLPYQKLYFICQQAECLHVFCYLCCYERETFVYWQSAL